MKRPSKTQRPLTRRVFLKYLLSRGMTHLLPPLREPTLLVERSGSSAAPLRHPLFFRKERAKLIRLLGPKDGRALLEAAFISKRRFFLLFSVEICRSFFRSRLGLLDRTDPGDRSFVSSLHLVPLRLFEHARASHSSELAAGSINRPPV